MLNRHISKNPRTLSFNRTEEIAKYMGIGAQEIQQIRADDLHVDNGPRGYQRPLSPLHVNRIAREFDPLLFGIIVISERADGSYWILDGQQRVGGILKMGKGQTLLPCEVLTGLSWTQEAEIYDKRNKNRKPQTPQEKFRGALAWNDPLSVGIAHTVHECGFTLNLADGERHGGKICATGTLIYCATHIRAGILKSALELIRDTWGTEHGPRGAMIDGVAMFLALYEGTYSRKRFITALSGKSLEGVHRESGAYGKATGTPPRNAVAAMIVRFYNERLQEQNRLPSIEEMRAIRAMTDRGLSE